MKKSIFLLAAVAFLALVSCNGGASSSEPTTIDSTSVAVDTTLVADSTAVIVDSAKTATPTVK
jgi:uncharacterized lipoprotein NlpE involved in copper resistance